MNQGRTKDEVWSTENKLQLPMVMSMMLSFCAVRFPRDVLDEILHLIESVSEDFPTYF